MTDRLAIYIPIHNRFRIVEQCVPTVRAGMITGHDTMIVCDDGSTEGRLELGAFGDADVYFRERVPVGIEVQRRAHFTHFWEQRVNMGWTHMYLTDSDALHDPGWRKEALRLHDRHGGAPICLYNTQAHVRLVGNLIEDNPNSDVIWRRVAPGISYLLGIEHVKKVVAALPFLPAHWNWDWTVPAILNHRIAIARQNYVDHIGLGGMHHPVEEGLDGGDRAINPTFWLENKRREVVAALSK